MIEKLRLKPEFFCMENTMEQNYTQDYLLDKRIKIFQPINGYRASSDAVLVSSFVSSDTQDKSILDVGSGTGAISLCIANRLKNKNISITGLELQTELADLSNKSATANGFEQVHFFCADIRKKIEIPQYKPCTFDIVVTNPPYSEYDMPSPNLGKAIAHNHQNFGLEQWLSFCIKSLKPFGKLYMINRAEALPHICSYLHNKAGNITILPIYSKENQYCKRVMIAAQKDSKAPCRILPGLIMHDESGKYTSQSENILRKGMGIDNIIDV